jgi:hypothetical protein
LRVAEPLLSAPVTNRVNWTLARLADEIAAREGVTISRSQLSRRLPEYRSSRLRTTSPSVRVNSARLSPAIPRTG